MDRDFDGRTQGARQPLRLRRDIDCAGEPVWMRQQPEIVARERVTIVEPAPDRG